MGNLRQSMTDKEWEHLRDRAQKAEVLREQLKADLSEYSLRKMLESYPEERIGEKIRLILEDYDKSYNSL